MRSTIVSHLLLGAGIAAGALFVPLAASAADFAGPAGWTKTDVPSPSQTRTITTWQIAGDTSTSITFIQDSSTSYADTLAAMNKNFTDNAIRLAINKDVPCLGTTGHVVEFTSGPEGARTIFNRLLVPVGAGLATVTYTRADGNAFENDVRKAVSEFCSSAPAANAGSGPPAGSAATPGPSAVPK